MADFDPEAKAEGIGWVTQGLRFRTWMFDSPDCSSCQEALGSMDAPPANGKNRLTQVGLFFYIQTYASLRTLTHSVSVLQLSGVRLACLQTQIIRNAARLASLLSS